MGYEGYRHHDGTSRFLLCGILLAGLAALLTVLLLPGPARAEDHGEGTVSVQGCAGVTVQMQIRERDMLRLINERRQKIGQRTFCVHPKLQQTARAHAKDMTEREYVEHENPEGKTPSDRVRAAAYRLPQDGVLQEVVTGFYSPTDSPQAAFNSWMGSSPHRRALSAGYYRPRQEIGVGAGEATHSMPGFGSYDVVAWAANMASGEQATRPKAKPNTAPRIGALKIANKKVRRGKYARPRIQAIVRDRETNLRQGQIRVKVDGKRMRVRYNRRNDRMVVRSQRLKRGKHTLVIRATDGQKKVVKRVRFRVR